MLAISNVPPNTRLTMASSIDPSHANLPSLPPELWIRILSHHNDLAHLWSTCRHISSTFRAYTEQVFAERHLKDIAISFFLEKYNLGGQSQRPEIPVIYDRREGGVAWFKDKRSVEEVIGDLGGVEIVNKRRKISHAGRGKTTDKGVGSEDLDEFEKVMDRWEENVQKWKPEMPNFVLRVEDLVNDTELPGLVFDRAQRAVGFEWRGMFANFYREVQRLSVLEAQWKVSSEKQHQENKTKEAKGESIPLSDIPPRWHMLELGHKKQIRRARLKQHYITSPEMLWAISSLIYFDNHNMEPNQATRPSTQTPQDLKLLATIPGAGIGERWYGSMHLLQSLYLDEWSCMHRIGLKVMHWWEDKWLKAIDEDDGPVIKVKKRRRRPLAR
ncbi:hypothetical protein P154DRAFT_586207 [Amniculicola lignicola CBS 123094]|uniref:F-box domain-containing protein n=1 Tax=Amniculicola lignicola CBS 123094 TaxID=1392246 RepID=A0A6A5WSS9_9PLEO|nr:hypothetical protein P154DRAFT_586207 [Amniculicola lignicola CBS 123094]